MTTLSLSLSSVEASRRLHPLETRFIGIPLNTDAPKSLKSVECSALQRRKQEGIEYSLLGWVS